MPRIIATLSVSLDFSSSIAELQALTPETPLTTEEIKASVAEDLLDFVAQCRDLTPYVQVTIKP